MAKLSEQTQKFISQYGEMASHWGLNRTECQIHALLFISSKPLDAEEISESLSVARSHVSNSLKELQNWGIVKVVHVLGSRREYFECVPDVWEMFRTVVAEQKRREIEPWMRILKEASASIEDGSPESVHAKKRIGEMLGFFETFSGWYEELRRLPTPMIRKFLAMAGKAISVLGLKRKE